MPEGSTVCPFCESEISPTAKKCRFCGEWLQQREAFCSSCGTPIRGRWAQEGLCAECEASRPEVVEHVPRTVKLKKRSETFGEGCAIQGFGFLGGLLLMGLIPVLGWIVGPIFIIGMLIHGSRKATKWICGDCGNNVAGPDVRVCPACRAHLIR